MMKNMRRGIPNLFKDGTEHLTGLEQAVLKNCKASKELQEITRTSLGPNGMNKLIINHLERIFVTSDCATIIKEMEIQHPAAKMVVMAANMQEAEVGDGSNFVVCLAGELLHQAEALVRMGLHPSEIVAGYNKAAKKALEILETLSVWTVEGKDMTNKEQLIKGIWSSISSKQYGNEEFIANLVADACLTVMPKDKGTFAVDNVRIVKVLGGSLPQSEVIKGMAIPHDTIGSIKRVKDAKVAVFNSSLQAPEIETKAVVEITSAEQLVNYNLGEEKEIEKQIRAIAESGVKVVITGGTVDDMAAHFLEKFGLMTLKVTSKFDLRRLAKACKARHMVSVGAVPPSYQGFCSNVFVKEVGGKKVTIFQQDKMDSTSVATILLRSSTENTLNDLERAVDDGVNTVRAMGRDGRFCAGAGAVDIELARQLAAHSQKSAGLDQYSIKKFAESLEVVPRTLAENAGLVPTDVIAGLYAAHEQGQTTAGISVDDGKITDMAKSRNIFDLLLTKQQAIKLAADAAVTVLRVDQIIQAKPAGGPKIPGKNPNWDDD